MQKVEIQKENDIPHRDSEIEASALLSVATGSLGGHRG